MTVSVVENDERANTQLTCGFHISVIVFGKLKFALLTLNVAPVKFVANPSSAHPLNEFKGVGDFMLELPKVSADTKRTFVPNWSGFGEPANGCVIREA